MPGVVLLRDALLEPDQPGLPGRLRPGTAEGLERLELVGPAVLLARGNGLPPGVVEQLGAITLEAAPPSAELEDEATSVLERVRLAHDARWLIAGSDDFTALARRAGLRVIRVGKGSDAPAASVSRPDYEARDLLDAVTHILTRQTFEDAGG